MSELDGEVAIVTGASRGIGRDVAERLWREGARVVVGYATRKDEAESVVDAIAGCGGAATAVRVDLSNPDDVRALFDLTIERFGRLDVLVANAGECIFRPLQETTEEDFDRMIAVNAKGTFLCLREAARRMADGGRIVAVSTIGTVLNLPGGAGYFASKAAIEQMCRVLAKEVATRGITVNVVSPGFIDTKMLRASLAEAGNGIRDEILRMTPISRLGHPSDVAEAITFLAGPRARWITRQNLAVDGGIISR